MKKLFIFLFVALLGHVTLQAQECTELFPGKNLHPDWQMTSVSIGLDTGWGLARTLISATEEPDHVYCGETSIAVGELTGGGCQGSLDIPVAFKPNTSYRVRARIFVDSKKFKIGIVGIGDLVGTTKNQEWELLDYCFKTGSGNYTTMYLNSCEGYNGNIGYIDNWEVYEWPDVAAMEMIKVLSDKVNSLYDEQKPGAQALKDAVAAGEALLLAVSPNNVDAQNVALNKAVEDLKEAIANYVEPFVSYAMDYTFVIQNPTFESSLVGWESTTGAQNNQLQTNSTQSGPDGTGKFWENWNGSNFEGQMYQVVTGLPNGNYTLKAAAFRSKNDEKGDVYLYAADADAEMTRITSETLKYHTVNCVVTGNALEIGLFIESPGTTWVGIDNVTLTYWGTSLNALKGILSDAEANYEKPMEAAVAMELAAAIAEAKNAATSQVTAEVEAAIVRLTTANEAAKESIAIYAPLKEKIDIANANKSSYVSFSGYAGFIAVLESIEQECLAGVYSADDIQDAINSLRVAEIACRITNPYTPADFTFVIWNPSFEEGQGENLLSEGGALQNPNFWLTDNSFEGWIDVKVIDDSSNDAAHDGHYMYNAWAGTVNYFNLYQEINLPAGGYTLSAAMRTESEGDAVSQYVYAEVDGIKYPSEILTFNTEAGSWKSYEAWIPLSVDFELEEPATIVIGAESNTGWFQIDDFRLIRRTGGISGINTINQDKDFSAVGVSNGILVKSNTTTKVNVYSVIGQLIRTEIVANGATVIPVASGLYIVNGSKVIVK
ncbi:hypothetical protein FACS189413_02270 [Bacteroidia bacterium]|nr:hypothetical protein FACS189413_02270 [Bacteroidia bacterium]